ncbi:tRNA (adenosine(37)-N6)-threonylcarbamoyltransferase complex dimerization subunit type 1 TsaB [Paracoccus sediminis]|uniref:tRNA (Adenosine(37)-N6)-threonylcarbamoyltransferase complex dimerization subunit type 1 TsaB n=1 Tax=Paracoccus sediminis TaxID=1214787 RepID=A0A238UMG5_9RHOB|nr:tRNA (adenosine(37)-N6)-threonylcarbamoyltransferase complex dimerization subunit type 1 TsaB [Paracoccus sediminis]TBN53087.1 tRNA (adenosine(37)-N6)-threonylcarbamoyltransferase complex dimerization subunit type 1 TsaB [Paracoccus sediminis]SNR23204.1 tRNA threonylcarbamoyl adenosine modification protein YeaZ [Paracoccus sediminis]
MPDPLALGFDTSAAQCAAALLRGETVLAQASEDMSKGQTERLFPLLQSLLSAAGLGWRDLDVIGTGIGPGNFTGIRIAVAAARGLALSLDIPAVGVTATEAAAFGLPRPCRVVLPLRADQIVWQDFGPDQSQPRQATAGSLPPGPAPSAPVVPPAVAIARIALSRRADPGPRPAPLYLRPADAAPARDAPPLILP